MERPGVAVAILLISTALMPQHLDAQQRRRDMKQRRQAAVAATELTRQTVLVDGVERVYWVAPPAEPSPAPPIVLVFHAARGTGEKAAQNGRLHLTAAGKRAFIAYPNGIGESWRMEGPADIAFVAAMLDAISKSNNTLDRSRVYAVGAGVGGAFVQRLACEMNDRFAAIAPVTAGFPKALEKTCKIAEGTPVLLLHNGFDREEGLAMLTTAETVDFWRKADGCTASGPAVAENRPGPPASTLSVIKPCRDGAEVRLIQATSAGQAVWMEDAAREVFAFFIRFRRLPRF